MNQQYNILLIINFLRMKKNKIMKDYLAGMLDGITASCSILRKL